MLKRRGRVQTEQMSRAVINFSSARFLLAEHDTFRGGSRLHLINWRRLLPKADSCVSGAFVFAIWLRGAMGCSAGPGLRRTSEMTGVDNIKLIINFEAIRLHI